jgi:hypothetical protein
MSALGHKQLTFLGRCRTGHPLQDELTRPLSREFQSGEREPHPGSNSRRVPKGQNAAHGGDASALSKLRPGRA